MPERCDASVVRRALAAVVGILVLVPALGFGVTSGGPYAEAAPGPTAGSVPGCTTAVAPGPELSGVETRFLAGPLEPFGVAISSNSTLGFVSDASGAIYVYSLGPTTPATMAVDSFRALVGDQRIDVTPLGLALTPSGRHLIAASESGAVVFDVARLEKSRAGLVSWTAGTLRSSGQGAIETAVSPGGGYVFVTLENSDDLAVFDLGRALRHGFGPSDLVGRVPLGRAPVGIAVAPNGRYLYVTSESAATGESAGEGESEGTLTTIDLKEAERRPSHAIVSTVAAGCSPVRVVATGSSVFVTARGSDAVLRFSASGLIDQPAAAFEGSVQVGAAPVGLALAPRGPDDRRLRLGPIRHARSGPEPGRRERRRRRPDASGRVSRVGIVPPRHRRQS